MNETETVFSDDDVVRSIRKGHVQHFNVLVDRYKHKITNFIHKMIFDYDEAQSLAQDVFIKVYESIKKYKAQDNFQAFIFTIAKNLTLNYIKKQKRVRLFSGFLSDNAEDKHFQCKGTQETQLEEEQKQALLMEGLKKINENQRIALVMKVYLDLSYNKIAEVTGWSIPKIETLISRAKSSLRQHVKPHLGGPGGHVRKKTQEKSQPAVLKVRAI